MGLTVMVIDESLGDQPFVKQLLEELEYVREAVVTGEPDSFPESIPDVFILGASHLGLARTIRKRFPRSTIIGRGPWQGRTTHEFFPWGDELREPTLPLTSLIPNIRRVS